MKVYQGHFDASLDDDLPNVFVNGRPLNPRFDLRNHSPTGFAWGYSGSGPAQLALAILCDYLQDDRQACELYQKFRQFVARLPQQQNWEWTSLDIDSMLRAIKKVDG